METQLPRQSMAQASGEFSKKLLSFVAAEGAAFWITPKNKILGADVAGRVEVIGVIFMFEIA